MSELVLRELEAGDEDAFRAAVREFAETDPGWEFAFDFDEDTDFAEYEYGGHVGFGVVAAFRRRGYGAEILRQTLARSQGIERLLVTCSDDNVASIRIIESCGGALEGVRPRKGGGVTRRYWIDLAERR